MSEHPHAPSAPRSLKRRADYFFATSKRGRREVSDFADLLRDLGPVVAIGGFLRDLCLAGNKAFESDVDFVVDPVSMREFEHVATRHGATPNRFGGYGITLQRWKVDVWPLERTWAAVQGHVHVAGLQDLLRVTFFDWDAVLYDYGQRRLVAADGYFDRLHARIIDINLKPNPNPVGNAVRAIRYCRRWDAALGAGLAEHVARTMRDAGWSAMIESERKSFRNQMLPTLDPDGIARALEAHATSGGGPIPLHVSPRQHELVLAD